MGSPSDWHQGLACSFLGEIPQLEVYCLNTWIEGYTNLFSLFSFLLGWLQDYTSQPCLLGWGAVFSRHECVYANVKEQTPFSVLHMDHWQPLYCSMGVSLIYCGTRLELRKGDHGSSCYVTLMTSCINMTDGVFQDIYDKMCKHQGGLLSDAERCLFFDCIFHWNRSNACLTEVALKGGCFLRNIISVIIYY